MATVLLSDPPQVSINGLYFGLFDGTEDNVKRFCRLYICGSARFDPTDESGDWTVEPAYFPRGRYSPSTVLRQLSDEAQKCGSEVMGFIEYGLCLGYASLAVKESRTKLMGKPGLQHALLLPMAVGFDSGDIFLLPATEQ